MEVREKVPLIFENDEVKYHHYNNPKLLTVA